MRGGGRPPKNALWFELSVASYLKTEDVNFDAQTLDLKSCAFDVNPPPYPNRMTKVGYDKEMDITAEGMKERYNISCKFSVNEDNVIGINSRSLHEAFLEFVPALNAADSFQKRMGFLLATNMRISKTFTDLQARANPSSVSRLRSLIVGLGKKDYGSEFNESQFTKSIIAQLTRQIIAVPLRISELERLHKKSEAFRAAFGEFCKSSIRTPVVGLGLLSWLPPDMTFFCRSKNHTFCTEAIIDGVFCHIGNLRAIIASLRKESDRLVKSRELARIIEATSMSPSWRNDGLQGNHVSHLKMCSTLTRILNDSGEVRLPNQVSAYVVPGSLDIILLDSVPLAAQLKASADSEFRFHPARVKPLGSLRLGDEALKEVTKLSLRNGMRMSVTDSDIVIDRKQEHESTV